MMTSVSEAYNQGKLSAFGIFLFNHSHTSHRQKLELRTTLKDVFLRTYHLKTEMLEGDIFISHLAVIILGLSTFVCKVFKLEETF